MWKLMRGSFRSNTIFGNWKSFKMMKMLLILPQKALFVPKMFRFLYWSFKNSLIRKIMLILKFMTPQPGKQTIAIHIFSNISRSNGNQTRKFSQLIECNMRIIFLAKSYTKCGRSSRWAKGAKAAFQILAKCCVFIATQMKKPNFERPSGLLTT